MANDDTLSPDPVDVHVGAEIRSRRKLANISQTALGERLGISFQQVQKYECGANRVSASMLDRCAKAFGCSPGDFFPPSERRSVQNPTIAAALDIAARDHSATLLNDLIHIAETDPEAFASLTTLARTIAAAARAR